MKILFFIAFATSSSLGYATSNIQVSEIHSLELNNRQILTIEEVKELEIKKPDGKFDYSKIPNLNNIELKNGLNITFDQLNHQYNGRMMEGGQDGGGG